MNDSDGHRKRLRAKFLSNGFDGFLDYEIIELLLTLGIPRKDCKPIAKQLISKYKTVNGVIHASEADLKRTKGLGDTSIIGLKLAHEIMVYAGKENLLKETSGGINIKEIANQAINEIGHSAKEIFKVYCINTRGSVISETVSIGTLDTSLVHPRELFKSAIENNAASIVIAHNHPGNDTTPSEEDVYATLKIAESGKILGINLDDHIIVSISGYTSLAERGYIK
jgi:DNA repair protein RadC